MSSTEAASQTTDGWGIDWRQERTWVTLVESSLQLGLVAAMSAVISVGLVTRILTDWHVFWLFFLPLAGVSGLSWFPLYGWVSPTMKQSAKVTDYLGHKCEGGSKADRIVFCWWSAAMSFAVIVLGAGLLALFNLHRSIGLLTFFVALPPASFVTAFGFPYVLDRLRQTAAKGPALN